MADAVFRHICPYNCYSSCGMISQVQDGKIKELAGDSLHGYTRGFLCARGYAFLDTAMHPERLVYPMRQSPRGSGRWTRISWDEAIQRIVGHLENIHNRYGSFKPVWFYNNSGNMGVMHRSWTWLAKSLGATLVSGSICWSAGLDALHYDVGRYTQPDPENMRQSRYILCWGANPAWTAIHQMEYLHQARENGAKLVVIDPVYTATAAQADRYIQLRTGTDGALALAIAHYLCRAQLVDEAFLQEKVEGWSAFRSYILDLDFTELTAACGVAPSVVEEVARELAACRPASIWLGFGLQRHTNGGQNFRAINALAALTGNLDRDGGGVYYANTANIDLFSAKCYEILGTVKAARAVPSYDLAQALIANRDSGAKAFFIANANPLTQNAEIERLVDALASLDLIVVADQFMTATARQADLVLPVTNFLEHWDIVASYWHNWIGLNQPAIPARGECRSDLTIVSSLAAALNRRLRKEFSFPCFGEEEWINKIFDRDVCDLLGIKSYVDLLEGPRRILVPPNPWYNRSFSTKSGRYELYSSLAKEQGLPALPVYRLPQAGSASYPYRLLTPHSRDGLNSQFHKPVSEITAFVSTALAEKTGLQHGGKAKILNQRAVIFVRIAVLPTIPAEVVVIYQQPHAGQELNRLAPPLPTDMGEVSGGGQALAFYDTFINILPA